MKTKKKHNAVRMLEVIFEAPIENNKHYKHLTATVEPFLPHPPAFMAPRKARKLLANPAKIMVHTILCK